MGRKSRQKRARRQHDLRWYCLGCGMRMHREIAAPAQAKVDEVVADGAAMRSRLIHICGSCKTLHFDEGGSLRRLTAAEELDVRMEIGDQLAVIERTRYPDTDRPAGTLEFHPPDRKR